MFLGVKFDDFFFFCTLSMSTLNSKRFGRYLKVYSFFFRSRDDYRTFSFRNFHTPKRCFPISPTPFRKVISSCRRPELSFFYQTTCLVVFFYDHKDSSPSEDEYRTVIFLFTNEIL